MKKILIALATAATLGLSACGDPYAPASGKNDDPHMTSESYGIKVDSAISSRNWSKIGVWTDPKTGCQYFTGEVSGGIFMTPRMSKGAAVCDEAKSSEYETYQRLKKQYEAK